MYYEHWKIYLTHNIQSIKILGWIYPLQLWECECEWEKLNVFNPYNIYKVFAGPTESKPTHDCLN